MPLPSLAHYPAISIHPLLPPKAFSQPPSLHRKLGFPRTPPHPTTSSLGTATQILRPGSKIPIHSLSSTLASSKPFSLQSPSLSPFDIYNVLRCHPTNASPPVPCTLHTVFLSAPTTTTPLCLGCRLMASLSSFPSLKAHTRGHALDVAISRNCFCCKLLDTKISPSGYRFSFLFSPNLIFNVITTSLWQPVLLSPSGCWG